MPGSVPGWLGWFQRRALVLFPLASLVVRAGKCSRQLIPDMAELLRSSGSIVLPLTAQVPVPLGHPRAPGALFLPQMTLDVPLRVTAA